MSKSHKEILERIYAKALEESSRQDYSTELGAEIVKKVDLLVSRSEASKGMMTVLITLFTHKIFSPEQDIRYHQAGLENGFAGRVIDKAEITPFMKSHSFPAMAESGWLTRSLEQPHPYTLDFPGRITPEVVKKTFLEIIDDVQCKGISAEETLKYIFKLLIRQREKKYIELAKPHTLTISAIIKLLERHFTHKYTISGASRLPVLAVYAAYQCMMKQVMRYSDKTLCPLESHNSADKQSGRIGDIDVNDANGRAFEGVEIKHEIQITSGLVSDAYEKFKGQPTDRYYLLTTANMDSAEWELIESETQRISNIHGCQIIVNGVYSTLKYYLRLLKDPAEFIDKYVELLKCDETIKFQHKTVWNELVNRH
ncbi:MAG: hypothetical protein IJ200_03255 [Prevotella sp.]|nr:hypothetical protein [Prevotella sp.]